MGKSMVNESKGTTNSANTYDNSVKETIFTYHANSSDEIVERLRKSVLESNSAE